MSDQPAPGGWYPDPSGEYELRLWYGDEWTYMVGRPDDFLDFEHRQSGELHTYLCSTYFAGDAPFHALQPGVIDSSDRSRNPVYRFGFTLGDEGERLAVWRAIAWAITEGTARYAITFYLPQDFPRRPLDDVGDGDLVRGLAWSTSDPPPRPPGWPRYWDWKADRFEGESLFDLGSWSDLTTFVEPLYSSDFFEIAIFGLTAEDGFPRLIKRLRLTRHPLFDEVFDRDDVLVYFAVGMETDIQSHLCIKARRPLPEVEALSRHYRAAFLSYQDKIGEITDFEQFATAVEQLLAPPEIGPIRRDGQNG